MGRTKPVRSASRTRSPGTTDASAACARPGATGPGQRGACAHVDSFREPTRRPPERRAPSLDPGTVRSSLIAIMDRGVDVLAELRELTADPDEKVRATAREYLKDLGRAR